MTVYPLESISGVLYDQTASLTNLRQAMTFQLDSKSTCIHRTQLRERIVCEVPESEPHQHGREDQLAFKRYI